MDYDAEASQFPDASRFSFNPILHPKPIYQNKLSFTGVKNKSFSLNGSKSKGLRNLSYRVKKIIESEQQTTYRFVADKLIKENNESNKDEQNVKRRVYDALNVLIAVGVIIKTKKFLVATDETFKSGKCHNKEKWEKIKEDQDSKAKKRRALFLKKQYLLDLTKRLMRARHLATRNNNRSLPNSQNAADAFLQLQTKLEPSQAQLSQQSFVASPTIVYQLPLLAFWAKPEDIKITVKYSREVTLHSKAPLDFMDESDIIESPDEQQLKMFDDKRFVNYYLELTKT